MLIDTHCHLTDKRLEEKLGDTIDGARESGVEKIVIPSSNLNDLKKAVKIANKNKGIYVLAGISPGQANKTKNWKRDVREIERLIVKEKKIVGIGEIGLDCYWDRKNLDLEIEVFTTQLKLATKLKLPVSIHNRLAEEEIKNVFESLDELPKGVFHCWGGDKDFLRYVIAKGFYISICGNITYKGNERLLESLKSVPLDRLLLETDSPYLPPEPKRGSLNKPKNVKITARFMADALDISANALINQTTKNSLCLFHLES